MVLLILGWAFFALVAQIYTCLMKAIVVEVVEAVVTASCDRLRQQLRVRTIYHTIVINIACDKVFRNRVMEMIGSGEKITGEELLRRYAAGERNFPFIQIDDRNGVLIKADLRGINLVGGYLVNAGWWNANLSGACLVAADFSGAGIDGSDLSNADLTGACLWGADLSGANLSSCILKGANLRKAILADANLRGVCLDSAILADASFNGAQNFVIHQYMTGILFWNTIMPDGSVVEGPVYIN